MSLTNPLGTFRNYRTPGGMISRQARISQTFRPNSLCFAREGSEHAEIPLSASPNPGLIVLGCYQGLASYTSGSTDDGTGGATNTDGSAAMVQIRPGIADGFATGTGANQIQAKHVDLPCFAFDDNTLYLTDLGGTLPFAGFVDAVASSGSFPVSVRMGEDQRVLFSIYSAAGLYPGGGEKTQEVTVRAVVTSLAAYGGAGTGVLTATANGALATQDGVSTLAVGDTVHLPVYGGTANASVAVLAADSGPYEITALGAAGSKVVLTRPAKWQHGAGIVQGTLVKVGPEGSLFKNSKWYAGPAAGAKVVGTDDPGLYPDRVTQSVLLVSGTVTIANVPLRPASGAGAGIVAVFANPTTVTTATGTVTYGPIVAPTPGALGTASLVVDAIATAQAKNAGDGSTITVAIIQ